MGVGVYLLHKNRFCSYCGSIFDEGQPWPRLCARCGNISYQNPAPVSIVLLPVDGGLLAVRRAYEPHCGKLALPGGYINLGEGWRQAGARELLEETGLQIDPAEIQLFDLVDAPDASLIIFGLADPRKPADLPGFTPNPEASERIVIRKAEELAFNIYMAAAQKYFDQNAFENPRR